MKLNMADRVYRFHNLVMVMSSSSVSVSIFVSSSSVSVSVSIGMGIDMLVNVQTCGRPCMHLRSVLL